MNTYLLKVLLAAHRHLINTICPAVGGEEVRYGYSEDWFKQGKEHAPKSIKLSNYVLKMRSAHRYNRTNIPYLFERTTMKDHLQHTHTGMLDREETKWLKLSINFPPALNVSYEDDIR